MTTTPVENLDSAHPANGLLQQVTTDDLASCNADAEVAITRARALPGRRALVAWNRAWSDLGERIQTPEDEPRRFPEALDSSAYVARAHDGHWDGR